MTYRLDIKSSAQRDLAALPKRDRLALDRHILALAQNPRPQGAIKLSGHRNLHRLRVGVYRVIYSIADDVLLVLVIHIAHRKDVYRGF